MAETREIVYKLRLTEHEDNARILEAFRRSQARGGAAGIGSPDDARRNRQREEQEDARSQQRILSNRTRVLDQITRQETAQREQSARQQTRLLAQLEQQHSAAVGRMAAGNAQMVDALSAAAPTILQFGRGLATLGVASEESTEKLLRGLVKVQAAFDIAVGAVQTYRNISKAMEGARIVTEAAGAAETAQRSRNLALANAQIAAEGRLAQARVASGAAGAGGGAATAAGGALTSGGAGFGARFLSGAGRSGPLALAGIAAAIATAAAGKAVQEALSGTGNAPGSLSGRVNSLYLGAAGLFGFERSANRRIRGGESRIQAARAAAFLREQQSQRGIDAQLSGLFASRELEAGRDSAFRERLGSATPEQQRGLLINRSGEVAGRLASLRTGGFRGEAGGAAVDDALTANQRLIELTRERLGVEKQIADERRKGAQETIQLATRELEITKDKIARERDSLLSAAERFGQLDAFQQAQLIALKGKAEAGQQLTRGERAALRGVGTARAVDLARQQDLAAARAGGFFDVFGSTERNNIEGLSRRASELNVTIRDQRELVVQIDREEDKIASQAAAAIARQLVIRDELLSEKIRREVQALQRQQEAQRQQAAAARAGVVNAGR